MYIEATQVKVPTRDCDVGTLTFPLDSPLLFLQPTIVHRPSKRPRLSLTDEEEGPSKCSLSMLVQDPEESIWPCGGNADYGVKKCHGVTNQIIKLWAGLNSSLHQTGMVLVATFLSLSHYTHFSADVLNLINTVKALEDGEGGFENIPEYQL